LSNPHYATRTKEYRREIGSAGRRASSRSHFGERFLVTFGGCLTSVTLPIKQAERFTQISSSMLDEFIRQGTGIHTKPPEGAGLEW
jgi:hypothetical protein